MGGGGLQHLWAVRMEHDSSLVSSATCPHIERALSSGVRGADSVPALRMPVGSNT